MERTPNQDQSKVIDDFSGNILLYASAGTGKTFTVAQKVKRIIEEGLARPDEILCLTFTIKACGEMREDIQSYNGPASGVEVCTIHGFCYQLVKEEARRAADSFSEPVICDDVDQEEILQKLLPREIAACRLRDFIRERHIAQSLFELFRADTVPILQGSIENSDARNILSPARLRRQGFFWKICFGGKTAYLSPGGILSEADAALRGRAQTFLCPSCKKRVAFSGNFCAECGYDLRTYIAPAEFALGKHGGYRNLVSLLKHGRAMHGRSSIDEASDYAECFGFLQTSAPQTLEKAFSYLDGNRTVTDEALLSAMGSYAGDVMHAYGDFLRQSNRLDFDDLIIEAKRYLLDPAVCARWQSRYRFIIVDEMQDTSKLEYDVLKRLFAKARVMMCGDFFQTIYEWRGSDPYGVLNDFRENFRPHVYWFAENYRSTKLLANAAFGYLKNTFQGEKSALFPQTMVAAREEEGERIRLVECDYFPDPAEAEAAFLFRYLKKHPADDPSKVCVMARSNGYINRLSNYFGRFNRGLPEKERLRFFTVRQDYRFFKTPVVKDILAFWTLCVNPTDELALERIARKYIDRVGSATVESIRGTRPAGISLGAFLEEDTYACGDPYRTLTDALGEGNIVVYDTETTGLDLAADEIVQIAAMKIGPDGSCKESFVRFIVPSAKISAGALQTHGYDLEYIRSHGGMSAAEALKSFSDFVKGAVLVGHNSIKFDRKLINRELRECGLPPLGVKGEYDTLTLAKLLCPALPDHKLSTLCEAFDIVNTRAHDAFADVEATAKILAALAAQRLEPQRDAREKTVRRYRSKFELFYEQYRAMRQRFSDGDLGGLNAYILQTFEIFRRYEKDWERDSAEVLFMLAKEKCAKMPLEDALFALLEEAALAGSEMDVLLKRLNKIPIITVHQAKGCEFDTVLLAGADNLMFPIPFSENPSEEKRLFYVAISRAKNTLILTCHGNHSEAQPRLPSKYFFNIPQEYVERYTFDGKRVRKYGQP